MKKNIFVLSIILVLCASIYFIMLIPFRSHSPIGDRKGQTFKVIAIKGNLLLLSNNQIVQLLGVYIPILGTNYRESLITNIENLLLNKNIKVEIAESKKNKYPKFPLAKIYLDGKEVNGFLLRNGVGFYDHGYYKGKELYYDLQTKAQKDNVGIWAESPPKVLFTTKKVWEGIHYVDCPEVKDIPLSERNQYFFIPEQLFYYKFFDYDCPYCGPKKPPVDEFADWNIKKCAEYLNRKALDVLHNLRKDKK